MIAAPPFREVTPVTFPIDPHREGERGLSDVAPLSESQRAGLVAGRSAWRARCSSRAGADIEMSASEVLAKTPDDRRGETPSDHTGHEVERERVVDREEERVVTSLALYAGSSRSIFPWPFLAITLGRPGKPSVVAGIDPWSSAAPTGSAVKGSAHAIGSRSDPAGARPVTLVPWPGSLLTMSVPPIASRRSAMPWRPVP